jgi:ActR/RegA family two-component response regulator
MSYYEIKQVKVLLLDGDSKFTDELAKHFERRNFEYIISNEVEHAMSLLLDDSFDVAILDFDMLKYLGCDIIEFLVVTARLNNEKIFLTTRSSHVRELKPSILGKGVCSVVLKPVNIEILCRQIVGPDDNIDKFGQTFFVN